MGWQSVCIVSLVVALAIGVIAIALASRRYVRPPNGWDWGYERAWGGVHGVLAMLDSAPEWVLDGNVWPDELSGSATPNLLPPEYCGQWFRVDTPSGGGTAMYFLVGPEGERRASVSYWSAPYVPAGRDEAAQKAVARAGRRASRISTHGGHIEPAARGGPGCVINLAGEYARLNTWLWRKCDDLVLRWTDRGRRYARGLWCYRRLEYDAGPERPTAWSQYWYCPHTSLEIYLRFPNDRISWHGIGQYWQLVDWLRAVHLERWRRGIDGPEKRHTPKLPAWIRKAISSLAPNATR